MGERPMLAGRTRDEVAAIYRAREPYYRQADLTVDTTGRTTDQVVAQVLLALEPRLSLSPLGRGQGEARRREGPQ
jgi:shikimate kinase